MAQILDYTLALEQSAGDETLAKEILQMLLAELPELRTALAQAIKDSDLTACWDHAHKLYGSTAYSGVPLLRECAGEMENEIKRGDMQKIMEQFELLSEEIDQVLQAGPQALQTAWS